MKFNEPLISGTFIRRYNRFIAEVALENGNVVKAHCPNSGSMKSCLGEGWPVRLSRADNPGRKLKYTWEMIHNGRCWIGINTHLANRIVEEGIRRGTVQELRGYTHLRREVKYGERSRVDILLEKGDKRCYVEIKNVTLVEEDGAYRFPDAVTTRGQKHLNELSAMVEQGHRAVLFFLIQRSDGNVFKPADEIDPVYGELLRRVVRKGVEVVPYLARVTPEEITLDRRIEYQL